MKIKQDFVTNSSSTCYLTFLPPDFDITKFYGMIENCHSYQHYRDDGMSDEDIKHLIKIAFKTIMDEGTIHDMDESDAVNLLGDILGELDLIVPGDTGYVGSDSGYVFNLNNKKTREAISTIKSGGWGLKFGGWGHEIKD